jgi:hypothetical protein
MKAFKKQQDYQVPASNQSSLKSLIRNLNQAMNHLQKGKKQKRPKNKRLLNF